MRPHLFFANPPQRLMRLPLYKTNFLHCLFPSHHRENHRHAGHASGAEALADGKPAEHTVEDRIGG